MKKPLLVNASLIAAAAYLSACGAKRTNNAPATTPADQTPAVVGPSDPDPTAGTVAAAPAAADIVASGQAQALVASSGLDSAASAAAAGGGANGASSTLALDDGDGLGLVGSPTLGQPSEKVTSGSVTRDCYLGSTLQGRSGTPSWPESADATSIFADSKNDPSDATKMFVEPLLLQYPATSPTTTLTLPAPFAFANLAEVIQKDNRATSITLNDLAQTQYSATSAFEEHRFWVAQNAITGQASAAVVCGPANDKGASGAANGTYARVKWSDAGQLNGLILLARFNNAGGSSRSFLPRKHGTFATTPVTINTNFSTSGYRLVEWQVTPAGATATIPNATIVRQKTVTHNANRTDQLLDASHNVVSDLSNLDQVRATAPMVIQEYRDAAERPLAQIISSGTVYKAANDATGAPKWFSSLAYNGVEFDLVNSTEPCIPVAGSVVMTVFDKEGGTQKGQVTITYSNVASAMGGGKVDPQISVAGDDADSTRAKWMMLHVNRKCDLK